MTIFDDLADWLRKLDTDNGQRARNRRRREHQGRVDGFAHSGEPSPIPVYDGTPTVGAMRTGIVTAETVGTGANIIVNIDNGSNKRSWVYHSVSAIVGGARTHIDKNYYIQAMDGASVDYGPLLVSEHAAGPAVTHIDEGYAHVPCTRLRMFIIGSTLNTTYTLFGIWNEDR